MWVFWFLQLSLWWVKHRAEDFFSGLKSLSMWSQRVQVWHLVRQIKWVKPEFTCWMTSSLTVWMKSSSVGYMAQANMKSCQTCRHISEHFEPPSVRPSAHESSQVHKQTITLKQGEVETCCPWHSAHNRNIDQEVTAAGQQLLPWFLAHHRCCRKDPAHKLHLPILWEHSCLHQQLTATSSLICRTNTAGSFSLKPRQRITKHRNGKEIEAHGGFNESVFPSPGERNCI